MANNLWLAAVKWGLAANRPTSPTVPEETLGFYYATDTQVLSFGIGGGSWVDIGDLASAAASASILANLPTEDPVSAGELWNDGGAIAISTGA